MKGKGSGARKNMIVIECWIRSGPTTRKYCQRMKEIWNKIGISKEIEQCLADQARMLRVNGSLTMLKLGENAQKKIDI